MSTEWWKDAIVYQIYPRSFQDTNGDGIGDLNGITMHLDYIRDLGADTVWLCPVYASPGDDNGYDISDYYAINPEFGTMEDFDRLLAAAHERGIRIIMDLVVNHTSDEHAWFRASRASRDNPFRDYYIWRDTPPNRWQSWFGGPAWEYDAATSSHYLHIFSRKQPDLNWANAALREDIYRMMRWWLDKGVDGFRMDVISLIAKPEPIPCSDETDLSPACNHREKVHAYLREMNERVLSHYDILTVGECPNVTVEEAKRYAGRGRHELGMVFPFEHTGLTDGQYGKWTDQRPPLPALKQVFARWQEGLHGISWNSLFWSNHDQPRAVSRFGCDLPEYRDVSAKMLCLCLYLMQGTPFIYQGEELGMANAGFFDLSQYRDLESLRAYRDLVDGGALNQRTMLRYLACISRDNARTPMQWSGALYGGFSTAAPWINMGRSWRAANAGREDGDPHSVLSFYKQVLAFRKNNPLIRDGSFRLLWPEDERIFAYERRLGAEGLLVLCNFSAKTISLPEPVAYTPPDLLLSNLPEHTPNVLRPYEAAAIRR